MMSWKIFRIINGLFLVMVIFVINGCISKYKKVNVIKPENEVLEVKSKDPGQKKADKKGNYSWIQKPVSEEIFIDHTKKDGAGKYLMNFEDIELPKFIEAMMSGVFKINFILTDQVKALKKKITVKMTEDLTKENAFSVFEKILLINNIRIEKETGLYLFSILKKPTVTFRGPIVYGRKLPSSIVLNDSSEINFLVPLHNITPKILEAMIKKQLSSLATAISINELNMFLVSGKYREVKYVLSLIELLDRAQFKDKSIAMISPKYWGVDDFLEKIKELLVAEGINWDNVEKNKALVFVPIESLNYVLIISSVKEWVDRIIYWLNKLDVPEAAGESKKVFCYRLKNVEVESVVEVLKGYRETIVKTVKASAKPGAKTSTRNRSDEKVLIPIKETNSIVIVASPVEYKKYLDILKKIDVPRNQVFIEVIIGEITLDNSTQLGMEFWINKYLHKTEFGTKGGLGVFKGAGDSDSIVIPEGSNLFVKGVLNNTQYELLMNALVTNSKINIVQSPKLTVVENEEAEIVVGSEIPVLSSESGYGGTSQAAQQSDTGTQGSNYNYMYPYRSINYVSTGIILKVKAASLSDNKISLEIDQEISNAVENTVSTISSPEISKRSIKTIMIVQEGQVAFIGGLIQNQKNTSSTGVPILSKIPLLGNLFKKTIDRIRKTELVVFINAKTIRKNSDMKDIVEGIKSIVTDTSYLEENQ